MQINHVVEEHSVVDDGGCVVVAEKVGDAVGIGKPPASIERQDGRRFPRTELKQRNLLFVTLFDK